MMGRGVIHLWKILMGKFEGGGVVPRVARVGVDGGAGA
jgi:hypothetical protein